MQRSRDRRAGRAHAICRNGSLSSTWQGHHRISAFERWRTQENTDWLKSLRHLKRSFKCRKPFPSINQGMKSRANSLLSHYLWKCIDIAEKIFGKSLSGPSRLFKHSCHARFEIVEIEKHMHGRANMLCLVKCIFAPNALRPKLIKSNDGQ